MKVSKSWLREWVKFNLTDKQLADQLTMAGLEVDALTPVAGEFSRVIVAEVVRTERHPQADKLTLCQVNIGTDELVQIVCGAPNVRAHLKVALALPGAILPRDIHIQETMLRGQLSQGMLCSCTELGIEDSSQGILELADDAPLGIDFREYLDLNDIIFTLELTPNRADCLSILGVAREVAALNQLPPPKLPHTTILPILDETLEVQLLHPEACPRYCGRVIRNINTQAKTPVWMQERLRRSGIRPLQPVVDVINYVMLELGQPMHAFDLDKLQGHIQVRYAHAHEHLTLIGGQSINLQTDNLIIADEHRPLALAGIMGGEESAVQESTRHIFLESAFFAPQRIAGVARRFGLSSESSQRYERGVDSSIQRVALERVTELLLSIVGGEIAPINEVCESKYLPQKATVSFDPTSVKRLSGLIINEEAMSDMLTRLGMQVNSHQKPWRIDIPSFRFDMSLAVDLVEEIVRLHGYHEIKAEAPNFALQAGKINIQEQMLNLVTTFFAHQGYRETISYSFVDPELQQALHPDNESMQLLNPISSELSHMRLSLWPGLIASVIYNIHRQQTALKLFETGVVFDVHQAHLSERLCLAGALTGEFGGLNWLETARDFDFYDLKGDLQALFKTLHCEAIEFLPSEHPALHPGKTAKILRQGKLLGWLGALHPRFMDDLDLPAEIILFELSLDDLVTHHPVTYKSISKYPQTRRDLSLLADRKLTAGEIEQVVRDVVHNDCLKAVDIFDVYTGESIPQDKKSLAIALTLQHDHRTLIDHEITVIIGDVLKALETKLSVTLRVES